MDEANSNRESLIIKEEEYHEGCPGCKVDRRKKESRGTPFKDFSFIWLVSLCTALPISSLYPFIYFMVRDFHIAKREEDIGYYAGVLGSSFNAGRAVTSIMWGVAADRFGRRPVILIGTFSVVIFNTLFGLSSSFWMTVSMRFFLGCFNSLLGTIRAYASEVCREEHRALALSVVSTSRGVGLVFGPAIGGFFAQPAEKYPSLFSQNSVFGRFPYFLPCFIISVYAAGIFVLSWWLPETLHIHDTNRKTTPGSGVASKDWLNESTEEGNFNEELKDTPPSSNENLFKNWPLMSVIIVYCIFSLQEISYSEIFSMWAVSDTNGGLGFSSQDVGIILAITGLGLLSFQLLVYPELEKRLGPLSVTRLSAALSIPLLSTFPYMALLSGLTLHILINIASLLRNILSISLVTGLFILLNDAVPQHQRGAANGISMTAMSIFKTMGPASAGALFSWAQKRQHATFLPGDHVVFFVLNVVQLIGLLLTFKPFLAQPT